MKKQLISFFAMMLFVPTLAQAAGHLEQVRYGTETVHGLDIFFREAGDPSKQAIVLLHGFPHSSHQYREVLAELGAKNVT